MNELKVGDKVERIKGYHQGSGMAIGDRSTVAEYKVIITTPHVRLKTYPGWHMVDYLTKIPNVKSNVEINEGEISRLLLKAMREIENKPTKEIKTDNKLNYKAKIEELKQQKLDINKQIEELESNIEEELDSTYITEILSQNKHNITDVRFYRKGRKITCLVRDINTNKILGKGEALALPGEEFKMEIGTKISFHRAMMNFNKKQMYKIIHSTC